MRFHPLAIIAAAYEDVYENWWGLLRVGALWVIAMQGWTYAADWSGVGTEGWLGTMVSLADAVAWGAIAVAWHRHIILNASLDGPMAPLNRSVFRYLIAEAAVYLVMSVVGMALMLPFFISPEDAGLIEVLLGGAVLLGSVALLARLAVWFPAIAVGDRSVGWRRSIELTRGHTISIAFGFFLVAAPVGLVTLLMLFLLTEIDGIALPLLSFILSVVATLVSIAVTVAYLSMTYLALAGPPGGSGSSDP